MRGTITKLPNGKFVEEARRLLEAAREEGTQEYATIALALAVETLRRHRAEQAERRLLLGELYEDHGLVFASEFGKPLHPHATLLLAQGVHPKVVQERLGHSNITLTLQLYSHVLPGMQREAAEKVEALIRPREERRKGGR